MMTVVTTTRLRPDGDPEWDAAMCDGGPRLRPEVRSEQHRHGPRRPSIGVDPSGIACRGRW
jgi:hypothetical protein